MTEMIIIFNYYDMFGIVDTFLRTEANNINIHQVDHSFDLSEFWELWG